MTVPLPRRRVRRTAGSADRWKCLRDASSPPLRAELPRVRNSRENPSSWSPLLGARPEVMANGRPQNQGRLGWRSRPGLAPPSRTARRGRRRARELAVPRLALCPIWAGRAEARLADCPTVPLEVPAIGCLLDAARAKSPAHSPPLGQVYTVSKLKSCDNSDRRQLRPTYPLEPESVQVQHTPCTVGSNSVVLTAPAVCTPSGGCDDEPPQAHSRVRV